MIMQKKILDWTRFIMVALMVFFAYYNYSGMIGYTLVMFNEPLEDMSHGWVIPFVSLFAIWKMRVDFSKAMAIGRPSWQGFFWSCLFLVAAWFGARGQQSRIEQLSLIGLIWSIPYALWGRPTAKLMLFPAGFLLFTVPISSFLDFFTMHLRMFSSGMATCILNGFGMAIERSGTALFSHVPGGEFNVDVADPCSGIRSLFAMMALTAAYAHFTLKTRLQKWMLFACSLPIAMIGNMFRIFSICLVARFFGQKIATGFYHDYSGFVIFVIGVLLMFEAGRWMVKIDTWAITFFPRLRSLFVHASKENECVRPLTWKDFVPVGFISFCVLFVFISNRMVSAPVYDSARFIVASLPKQVGSFNGDQPWFCHNEQCNDHSEEQILIEKKCQQGDGFKCPTCGGKMEKVSMGELQDLPKDTEILKRVYRSADGLIYSVSVVIAGRSRGSIHRAELCLPAQGFVMLSAKKEKLDIKSGHPREARIIQAQRSSSDYLFSLVYWFVSPNHECASHAERISLDIWDRSILNRINRWAMVAINVSAPLDDPEARKQFEAFLDELYPKILLK
ncbi:MAG: exosortase/archaeosortase family protein [bacterium]